jgi:uncharacterized protein (TIGR00725 family)
MTYPIVSVFGASAPRPDDPDYQSAERLGRLLAEAGHAVMTGGYGGVMEAVSKGAKLAGGHVIGVTVTIFEGDGKRPGPNAFVDDVIQYPTLRDRLYHLVTRCDAAIAVSGGIGTLSEVALLWSLLQVGEVKPIPFVLLGDHWRDVLTHYYGNGEYIRPEFMALLQYARTPEDAVAVLKGSLGDTPATSQRGE